MRAGGEGDELRQVHRLGIQAELHPLRHVLRVARGLDQRIQGQGLAGGACTVKQPSANRSIPARPAAGGRRGGGPSRSPCPSPGPAPWRRHAASARRHGHCRKATRSVSACTRRKRIPPAPARPRRSARSWSRAPARCSACRWRDPPCHPARSAPPPIRAARRARSRGNRRCRGRAACRAPRSRRGAPRSLAVQQRLEVAEVVAEAAGIHQHPRGAAIGEGGDGVAPAHLDRRRSRWRGRRPRPGARSGSSPPACRRRDRHRRGGSW